MNRRDRKKEQTRTKLLDAAMAQFVKHGIYSTRIEDITESADVAKGAFYNYFDSKNTLIAELLSQGIELLEIAYFRRINEDIKGRERVRTLVEKQESFWQTHPEYALLFHQARGLLLLEPKASELKRAFREYLECIARNLPEPNDRAEMLSEQAIQRAAALAGLIAGYRSFAFASGLQMDLELAVQIATSGIPSVIESTNGLQGPVSQTT